MTRVPPLDDTVLRRAVDVVRARYAFPLLAQPPRLVETDVPGFGTAFFSLADHRCEISVSFLATLRDAGLPPAVALRGVLTHELGHYVVFPRELSTLLYLGQAAERRWPQTGGNGRRHALIVDAYCDIVNNIDSFASDERDGDLIALYRVLAKLTAEPFNLVLLGLYQRLTDIDLGVSPTAAQAARVEQLAAIDYTTPDVPVHGANVVTCGEIIEDLLPAAVTAPGLADGYTNAQLNDALDAAVRRFGKGAYDRLRRYLDRTRAGFRDREEESEVSETDMKVAGTVGACQVQWNDEQISYYRRLAATYGVFIAGKPIRDDADDAYPSEQVPFEVGDELQRLNPWSSPRLLPGITQRWKEAYGRRAEWRCRVPDLLLLLDSSASMRHPAAVSYAVLAAFVLARNYHANGARVGLMNFSADILFVPPSRRLAHVYRGACAYWGGGTVLNVAKIREWLTRLRHGDLEAFEFSDAADYQALLKRLDVDDARFREKRITLPLPERGALDVFERLDTVIITDGAITNIDEVIVHIQRFGRFSRTWVLLINNPDDLRRWRALDLSHTEILSIDSPSDIMGLALGRIRAAARSARYTEAPAHV